MGHAAGDVPCGPRQGGADGVAGSHAPALQEQAGDDRRRDRQLCGVVQAGAQPLPGHPPDPRPAQGAHRLPHRHEEEPGPPLHRQLRRDDRRARARRRGHYRHRLGAGGAVGGGKGRGSGVHLSQGRHHRVHGHLRDPEERTPHRKSPRHDQSRHLDRRTGAPRQCARSGRGQQRRGAAPERAEPRALPVRRDGLRQRRGARRHRLVRPIPPAGTRRRSCHPRRDAGRVGSLPQGVSRGRRQAVTSMNTPPRRSCGAGT